MDANATGHFIAQIRKQKGYTQKELAEKLMVTDKAISRWETGVSFQKRYFRKISTNRAKLMHIPHVERLLLLRFL